MALRRTRAGAAAVLALLLGGCGGGGLTPLDVPTSPAIELDATEMRYIPDALAVREGTVRVVLRNVGRVIHDLRIERRPQLIVEARAGQTTTTEWELEEGRYVIYCSIPGHRSAGMDGRLDVRPADAG